MLVIWFLSHYLNRPHPGGLIFVRTSGMPITFQPGVRTAESIRDDPPSNC